MIDKLLEATDFRTKKSSLVHSRCHNTQFYFIYFFFFPLVLFVFFGVVACSRVALEHNDKQTLLQCFLESVCEECLLGLASHISLIITNLLLHVLPCSMRRIYFSCCTMYYLNKVQCGSELLKNVLKSEGSP